MRYMLENGFFVCPLDVLRAIVENDPELTLMLLKSKGNVNASMSLMTFGSKFVDGNLVNVCIEDRPELKLVPLTQLLMKIRPFDSTGPVRASNEEEKAWQRPGAAACLVLNAFYSKTRRQIQQLEAELGEMQAAAAAAADEARVHEAQMRLLRAQQLVEQEL